MNIFDRRNETMSRDRLDQFQLERLQALLARLNRNLRHYREKLGDLRVEATADIARLPITEPEDLQAGFPYGMFALPLREIIRLHSVVGSNGMQVVVGHTRNDLTQWARLAARQLVAAGVTAHDVIQISFGRRFFPETLGYMLGAEMIEASVISEGPFHVEYQLATLQSYRATVLITTPTNARELVQVLNARRMDPQSLHLRSVILSRPVGDEIRDELKTGLFADVWCTFGVPEILDPGLTLQCDEGRFHVNEDHFVVEERDGELLVTTLAREAMPLLRYATRTTCELRREKCRCGRTGLVIEPGPRTDGRLRVNETPLYACQIADILARTRAAGHPFEFDVNEERLVIYLAVTHDLFEDTMRTLVDLQREIQSEFFARLGVEAEVRYLEPADFEARRGGASHGNREDAP